MDARQRRRAVVSRRRSRFRLADDRDDDDGRRQCGPTRGRGARGARRADRRRPHGGRRARARVRDACCATRRRATTSVTCSASRRASPAPRIARAVEPLEKLAARRNSLDVRQAAQRGLAVGFRDEDAIKALRRELSGKDEELELRAAQVLYELADEEAFAWAVDVITQRRTADAGGADVRGQVVRDLVELGGEPSRQALRAALDDGSRNEWIEAWIAVGLLELGDESVSPQVEAALMTDDWELDPRGVRSIWRAIKPFLAYAAQLAMSGGMSAMSSTDQLRQVTSLIGNAVQGERARHLSKLDQRAVVDGAAAVASRRCDREGAARGCATHAAHACSTIRRRVWQGSAALALGAQRRCGGAAVGGGRLRRRAHGRRVAAVSAGAARDARSCRRLELAYGTQPRRGCWPKRNRTPIPACGSSRSPPRSSGQGPRPRYCSSSTVTRRSAASSTPSAAPRLVVPGDAIVDVGQAGAAQQRRDLLGAAARERRLLRQRGAIREEHVAAVARDARAGALCGCARRRGSP